MMATATTPPAPMLSKKFSSDGLTAASATSGAIIEAVSAAAVSPVTAFSFSEALTWNFPAAGFETNLDGLNGNGFKNVPAEEGASCLFWVARAAGAAMETAEVEAISVVVLSLW